MDSIGADKKGPVALAVTLLLLVAVSLALCGVSLYKINKLSKSIRTLSKEAETSSTLADLTPKAEPRRWQIHQSTLAARDQFLVDTSTGRVWQLVQDPDTKKTWWSEMTVGD